MKYNILLNKKYSNKHPYFKNSKKEHLSELFERYNGFEGECLYFFQTDNEMKINENIDQAKKKIKNIDASEYLLLLCIKIQEPEKIQQKIDIKSIKLGYDFGILVDQDELYSSILQEIIFGHEDELKIFKEKLNDNFLFSVYEEAIQYRKKHHQLAMEEKNVEIEDDMEIYKIYKIEI
ncbi:hypothetical protein KJ830_03825 [bacterium]|nr:hypothetical protein [bacterium]